MNLDILNNSNGEEFLNYLQPFVEKAKKVSDKELIVVIDGHDDAKLLWIKCALVLELPWYFKYNHDFPLHYRESIRERLVVSSNTNLYIEKEVQKFEYKYKWKGFKKKIIGIKRKKYFSVYEINVDLFRRIILRLKQHNMLTDELKKCLVRDG